MDPDFNAQIQAELAHLDQTAQSQVLEFVRQLNRRQTGTPGNVVASFAGLISADELERMEKAIQLDCEQVDSHEW